MTQLATDIFGTAFKNGTATLMARILGADAAPIRQADVQSIVYSIYLLDDGNADLRRPVPGHAEVPLAVGDVIRDTLQSAAPWDSTADATGYNFGHTPDVSQQQAFPTAGRRYLVEYRLTPPVGQVILVRFRINVI
jgi:hypothetical protein